jgi:eukaryotic-like serine/threonine-protein kinase
MTPGTKLGPYEIRYWCGRDGRGVSRAGYAAGAHVAIRVLPAQFCSDTVCKRRFEREAKIISQLNHPHICVLHDIGSYDGSIIS